MGEGGRGGVPDDRAVLEVGADKGIIKTYDGGRGRMRMEVPEEEAKNFSGFATYGRNVGRP